MLSIFNLMLNISGPDADNVYFKKNFQMQKKITANSCSFFFQYALQRIGLCRQKTKWKILWQALLGIKAQVLILCESLFDVIRESLIKIFLL